MKKILLAAVIGIGISLSFIFLKANHTPPPLERNSYALGTLLHFTVWGENAEPALEKALDRISEIERHMSSHYSDSDVNRVNRSAGSVFEEIHGDTLYVLLKALAFARKSSGAFDPTIGVLVKLWGIGTPGERLPSAEEIAQAVSLVNYEEIQVDETGSRLQLSRPGQCLDLGGIAKGYAADEVVQIFKDKGVHRALIDLGGNIFVLGTKPDGSRWSIGVQNPLEPRGQYLGILSVSDKSVVTSGTYERFFEKDGKRYHHIFDPATGYPAESGLLSVTILSECSIDGDALSTALFVLGKDDGLKLASSIDGVEALVVTKEKKIYGTAGMDTFFKLTNKEYTYEKGK